MYQRLQAVFYVLHVAAVKQKSFPPFVCSFPLSITSFYYHLKIKQKQNKPRCRKIFPSSRIHAIQFSKHEYFLGFSVSRFRCPLRSCSCFAATTHFFRQKKSPIFKGLSSPAACLRKLNRKRLFYYQHSSRRKDDAQHNAKYKSLVGLPFVFRRFLVVAFREVQ